MTDLTATLRKSIEYEQSKTDLTNLLNHTEGNLSLVIDAIEHYMREFQSEIDTMYPLSDDAIAWRKNQIQSLIAWRTIFFCAIEKVKE
jgi:hypothetical protein